MSTRCADPFHVFIGTSQEQARHPELPDDIEGGSGQRRQVFHSAAANIERSREVKGYYPQPQEPI